MFQKITFQKFSFGFIDIYNFFTYTFVSLDKAYNFFKSPPCELEIIKNLNNDSLSVLH